MSHSTVCNTTVSNKKTRRTLEISTPVVCNAACVQRKRSCKREGETCVCATNQARAWVCVCVCVCVCLSSSLSRRQLLVCANTHTHTSRGASFIALPVALLLHTHTSSCVLKICLMMIHTPILMIDCVAQNIFLFHVYRSLSLACMRRYTQLAYLFHQCATSLFSRNSCIADCTVRHQGVECPFSSIFYC